MFKRVDETKPDRVTIFIEDRQVSAPIGNSVAAAMLAAGFHQTGTTAVSGVGRAPFCLMGVCFDCLVEIDGLPNQQACQIQVRQGMRIKLQQGVRELKS